MKKLELKTSKHGLRIILYFMRDFEYDRSIAKYIFPKVNGRNQMTTIRENISRFNLLDKVKGAKKNNYFEMRKVIPVSSKRKRNGKSHNIKPRKKTAKGYRFKMSALFDLKFITWELSDRSKKILEVMLYPDFIRKFCFNLEAFDYYDGDFEKILESFFKNEFFNNNHIGLIDAETLTWSSNLSNLIDSNLTPQEISNKIIAETIFYETGRDEEKTLKFIKTEKGYSILSRDYFFNEKKRQLALMNYYPRFLDIEFICEIIYNIGGWFALENFIDRYFPEVAGLPNSEQRKKYLEEASKDALGKIKKLDEIKEKYREKGEDLGYLFYSSE